MKDNKRSDNHSLASEIIGILLFALSVFLFVSLLSFDRYDHLIVCERQPGVIRNYAGVAGALVAMSLLWPVGLVAHLFPVASLICAWRCFIKGAVNLRVLELFVFLVMLLSLATLFSVFNLFVLSAKPLAIEISGGLVGYFLAELLARWLTPLGSTLLLSALSLVCVVLFLRFSVGLSVRGCRNGLFAVWQYTQLFLPADRLPHGPNVIESKDDQGEALSFVGLSKSNPTQDVSAQNQSIVCEPSSSFLSQYRLPSLSLLDPSPPVSSCETGEEQDAYVGLIEQRLAEFNVAGKIVGINPGPVVTMYEFEPEPGVKLSKIVGLSDDLVMALSAMSVRIVAPIPGRGLVGIEVPNVVRETITIREIIGSEVFQRFDGRLPVALGKDTVGEVVVTDVTKLPHLIFAGSTGAGKSVAINCFLLSLLYALPPRDVRFILIDTKMLELSVYEGIPHLLLPVVTDSNGASRALEWAVQEMRRRYQLLADMNVRNIDGYNKKIEKLTAASGSRTSSTSEAHNHVHLPYLVICVDEYANLMMIGGKKVEDAIVQLAQMARASGIHLILATQRPSVDIITGTIKSNMPARISFKVPTRVDSRTVLDQIGAESLLGNGDCLFLSPEGGGMKRVHGAFVSDEEVERVVGHIKNQAEPDYEMSVVESVFSIDSETNENDQDELWEEALKVVAKTKYASISHLQRHLRIGFNRAARMIEHMEREGFVSSSDTPDRRREVLLDRFPPE